MVVKHNKTDNLYQLIDDECKAKINGEWIDAVIYHGKDKETGKIRYFVREKSDFDNHFIEVDDIKPNSEYSWLIYRICALKEVAAEYPGKTIENIIVQMEARKKEVEKKMKELEDLKKGDKVIVSGLYRYDMISQVERVTNKYIFVESVKFSKAFGRLSWCRTSSAHIKPATEEDIRRVEEETEKRNIVNYLTIANFEKLSFTTLVAIRDIVEKEIGKLTTKEIEMWLARDKEGRLHLFRGEKPKRFLGIWSISSFDVSPLQMQWFPEVKWSDNEPTKVKLVIEK